MNLEHCRKDAKALLRGVAAQDPDALARAYAVLDERVRARFLLSDAQHVVAVERGYRSWRELRAAAPRSERYRRGVVPVVAAGPGERAIVERIARASLTFYEDLLELE
jgi:hypothetical protein